MSTETSDAARREYSAWRETVWAEEPEVLHARFNLRQWILAGAALTAVAYIGLLFARGQIDWATTYEYLFNPLILDGITATVFMTALSLALGLVLGVVFGVMRLSTNSVLAAVAWGYVWVFRGTPVLVQLLLWYNLALILPSIWLPLVGTQDTVTLMTPLVTVLLGLSINEGAYLAEVIRSGIVSVHRGQEEAGAALGMSRTRIMRTVVLPQAMPAILPNLGNSANGLLKMSSLASVVSYPELVNRAQSIYFANGRVMELLMVVAFWYLMATSAMSVGQYYLERHFGRGTTDRRSGIVRRLSTGSARLGMAGKHIGGPA
ncbi:amino acid ABC transporter permease [Mycolicibacterium mengxianglii]|uniref:amino acid ABC transporter permease n=1 Tax=Mycolicibacterium mengxianglii TaxID=2736649 RepID=UPI0018D1333D|nr:amino acid ABC transporter permease [Mycolicibacterium mengxianglii]